MSNEIKIESLSNIHITGGTIRNKFAFFLDFVPRQIWPKMGVGWPILALVGLGIAGE